MRIGLYENNPKVGADRDGRPVGIFVEIIREIARTESWDLTFVPGTWRDGLDRLARGDIDLMPDVAFTAERDRLYSFHEEPVLSSWSQVYTRRGDAIRSLPDLGGRRVAVLEGSMQQEQFKGMIAGFDLQVQLIPFPDLEEAFRSVADERAEAVVTNRFFGVRHADTYGLVDTAIIFSPSRLYFAAPKDKNEDLLAAIDRHLRALKRDSTSTYYRTLRRWTTSEAPPAIPAWLWWGMLAAMLLLLLFSISGGMLWRSRARLKRSNERQRQLVADLAVAKEAAESADRMKSAFLAAMSHELRTPLNSIIGFTGILLQGLAGSLNDEQTKQLGMVKSSASHLLALINDVLDLSKIEAGKLQVTVEQFDLRASIEKMIEAVRPQAVKKNLTLETDIGAVGSLVSDRRRVEQVLLNLLSNGIKFTERGHVRVVAVRAPMKVTVTVADTGLGIKEEDQDLLFKPFSQIDGSISRRHEGTGLGLSVSKRLVELLGGSIWFSSEWQRGSTFGFELPIEVKEEQ